jgi:drug/metabolite transporter (DMT)-like permease
MGVMHILTWQSFKKLEVVCCCMAVEIGILLAVLALLGWGAYPALLKKIVDSLGAYTCLLFHHIVLVLFIGLTAVFTLRLRMPSDFVVAAIIIGAIVGTVAVYLYYKAINEGHVSVIVVIAAMHIIWTVIASYFLFSERLTLQKYLSIAVIFVGALLVAMEKPGLPRKFTQRHFVRFLKSGIWSRGAGLALLVSFCWAFFNLASKYSVNSIGPHATLVYVEVLVLVFILFAFLTKPAKELVTVPKKRHWKWLVSSALLFSGSASSDCHHCSSIHRREDQGAPVCWDFACCGGDCVFGDVILRRGIIH